VLSGNQKNLSCLVLEDDQEQVLVIWTCSKALQVVRTHDEQKCWRNKPNNFQQILSLLYDYECEIRIPCVMDQTRQKLLLMTTYEHNAHGYFGHPATGIENRTKH